MISVVIVGDHRVVAEGIEQIIKKSDIAHCVGMAYSMKDCWKMLCNVQLDIFSQYGSIDEIGVGAKIGVKGITKKLFFTCFLISLKKKAYLCGVKQSKINFIRNKVIYDHCPYQRRRKH